MDDFKNYLYEEERSFNTVEKYLRDVCFFAKWIGGKCIEKSDVLEYKKKLCEEYTPKSVNSMLSSINAFFNFLGWYELRVKTLKIQRQIFLDKEKELTKSEYERLLKLLKTRITKDCICLA